MFGKKILNYCLGYVHIKVEGFFIERFINMCIAKKIILADIKREKSTIMYANVGIKEYKKLKPIAKKTKTKIKIENKKGLPFMAHKYRKRKLFCILCLTVLLCIIISSNYIWNIEIIGNVNIPKEELLSDLEKCGLGLGISKNNMDANSIISQIRLERDDIAWIGISIKGTNAIVKIKEVDKAPDILNEDEYCNIVANKPGMITKVNVQNGTSAVNIGDIVEEGTILVNGYMEGEYTGVRFVHSQADIEARVWYTKTLSENLTQEIKVETGNEERKYSIKFKKNQINLFKTLSKFQKYDTINENKKVKLFSDFYLPIEIIKTTNKEYELKEKTYTQEELVQKLTEKLKQEILESIEDTNNIINIVVNEKVENNQVEVEVTYEVLEKIGIEQTINF